MTRDRDVLRPLRARLAWGVVLALLAAPAAHGGVVGVTTFASTSVGLPATTLGAGPYPFPALGIQAAATYTPGPIDVTVGGGTTFTYPTIASGTTFTSADSLSIGYSPFWTGSVTATSGLGARADVVWNIGPFSGSHNLLNEQVDATAKGNVAFGGALQGGSASDQDYTGRYGAVLTANALVASASIGAAVQGHLTQSVTWTPTATYGYWWWADTDGVYDAGDALTWHGVSAGSLDYSFASLTPPGSSFFLNFIPGVMLDMPITFDSRFGIDADGYAEARVLGIQVAQAWFPLGTASWDLLNTSYDFDPYWYASETFTIPLTGSCAVDPATGLRTCTGFTVPAPTSILAKGGPPSGGPGGFPYMPAPQFLPSPGFTDQTTGGFCFDGKCYTGLDDDRLPVDDLTVSVDVAPVPEPGSLLLLGAGLVGLGARVRRRRSGAWCRKGPASNTSAAESGRHLPRRT